MFRSTIFVVLLLALAAPAAAQVGLAILGRQPEEAEAVAWRALRLRQAVLKRLERGPLDAVVAARVMERVRELAAEAKRIELDVRHGLAVSLSEKEIIEKNLETTRRVCRWLKAHASRPR